MQRTTLVLPEPLKQRAVEQARSQGLSFGEFVRRALEAALENSGQLSGRAQDPFWADQIAFGGSSPSDLSANHDGYLYGVQE